MKQPGVLKYIINTMLNRSLVEIKLRFIFLEYLEYDNHDLKIYENVKIVSIFEKV